MYSNHSCPRCGTQISMERMLGNVVVCTCGWSGDKSHFEPPKRNFHIKKIMLGLTIGAIVFTGLEAKKWGKNLPERFYYKTLSTFHMTSAKDEASMAYVCQKKGMHICAAKAYTKALAKAPQAHNIAGALAIELVKVKEYDRAILTFQNYFSHEDGQSVHKQQYAKALSAKEYVDDATEWYYKALQADPKNFEAAEELVQHLSKNENFVEALSVIGHYNTVFPKQTMKEWAKLKQDVISSYEKYTSTYDIKEIKISGINKFLYAPVKLSQSGETQLFLVDPESEFLTLDKQQLQSLGVDYKDRGEKEVMATNGRYLKGTEVIVSEMKVGPFHLKNVKAIACDNCAFLLGKDVMKSLHSQAKENKGIKYITLKQ